jgi:rfaE bifunctional protein kinase chain/domain
VPVRCKYKDHVSLSQNPNLIDSFAKQRILVVGDLMLDVYVRGLVERISPEAPVPVVVETSRDYILGGAANVAANIASLGGKVALMGYTGDDDEAKIMKELCVARGITPRFVKDGNRPTAVKMRIVASRHQLVRLDRTREICADVDRRVEKEVESILRKSGSYDLVILSDYAKGFLTKRIVAAVTRQFGRDRVVVGAKPSRAALYKQNARVVILNLAEGKALTGVFAVTDAAAARAVKKLSDFFKVSIVLTRGEFGMTVYDKAQRKARHIPTRAVRVYDVTGAGDTALAALGLMLAAGATLAEAAEVANHAAGIAVGLEGTTSVSASDLKRNLH